MVLQKYEVDTKKRVGVEEIISEKELHDKVTELCEKGARFITITSQDIGDQFKIIYHFEQDDEVVNLYLLVNKDKPVKTITDIYQVAFIAENEVQDLFKVKFDGLNLDLQGKMLKVLDSPSTLLKPVVGTQPPIKRFLGRCREECPAMVNIPRYLRQIAKGDPEAAYNTIIERAPLPAILGRVCFAPCQEGCRQEVKAKPIQVRLLKRFAADAFHENNRGFFRKIVKQKPTVKRVAVIGGGPSGVSAAYFLGTLGHKVSIFEKRNRFGGAMLWGIPKYRLPKDVLAEEINARLKEAEVEIKLNTHVRDLHQLLMEGYDAIYIAVGSEQSNNLRCEGEESPGVIDFQDFLTAVNVRDEKPEIGEDVIVIGGGNSAMDSARTAKRLGAENVTVYYRRTENEMPALLEEIHGAMREGISFEFLSSQIIIHPDKHLMIEFQSMIPGEPDVSGRRRPVPMEGRDVLRTADTIIKAIGTSVSIPEGYGVELDKRGQIIIDDNYATSQPGVFAGGDAVFGASSVIQALRDARKAASSIDTYLGGEGLPEPYVDMTEFVGRPIKDEEFLEKERVICPELTLMERISSFDEVELGLDEEKAIYETSRCWRCDWNE